MGKKRITDLITFKKQNEETEEAEMSFFDHLEVLRWHLIRSAIAIVIFTTLAFVFYNFIFRTILMGPARTDFWTYRMLCILGEKFNMGADLCVKQIPIDMINSTMAGQFMFNMNSGLMIGVVAGIPYLLFELWNFIKPGLKDIERKSASGFVFYASLLFFLGVLFGYYIVTPLSINFLSNYTLDPAIKNLIPMDEYLSFMGTLTIGTGITFELPILIFILSKMGIVTPKFMRSIRRYATISIFIIAAVVTPGGDILTMLTVSFPLFLLYEVSIIVSDRVEKRRKKAEADFYSGA
jgi:sec-independent protein translocase protein TatC